MREPGTEENVFLSPEKGRQHPPYTRGLALFALGPPFWEKPVITPIEVDNRMQQVWPVEVYKQFAVVDAVSNDQRGGHVPTREEVRSWIGTEMPAFFHNMRQMTGPDAKAIKEVLKKNFRIDVDKAGSDEEVRRYLTGKSAWLWETFFADGQSNTGEFIRALTRDVLWARREDYDRRIMLSRPLFGLFGGEETAILLEHAALAYDHVYDHEKPEFVAWAKRAVGISFSSPAEQHAYELAAAKITILPTEPNWRMRRREDRLHVSSPSAEEMRIEPVPAQAGEVPQRQARAPVIPTPPVETSTNIAPQPEQEGRHPYVTAQEIAASPDHPKFSADRALALSIAGGESVLVSAMDGIGSGEEYSVEPARIMDRALQEEMKKIDHMPSIREGTVALARAYYNAATKIDDYKDNLKSKRVKERIREQVGTVGAAAVVCRDQDRDFLVTMNLGDSRVYVFYPESQELKQVTRDHNIPQLLVRNGSLSAEEAFVDPRRNGVYKSVTVPSVADMLLHLVTGERSDDYVIEILRATPHVIFATTDGWTDNTPPEWEVTKVTQAYKKAFSAGKFDPAAFTHHLVDGAREVMQQRSGTVIRGNPPYNSQDFVKKDDIGIAVAYRWGRT